MYQGVGPGTVSQDEYLGRESVCLRHSNYSAHSTIGYHQSSKPPSCNDNLIRKYDITEQSNY